MKLHEALRKVIRHFGVSVIEDKSLMSFFSDCRAFDDCPSVREVMQAIASGSYGKRLCLAADESDKEFLRFADSLRDSLVREENFRQELADYAVDSILFALGIISTVKEPGDHGSESAHNGAHDNTVRNMVPDGAESHRSIYRGKDLTSAFESGEFSEGVADGSFRNIFPGDYITKEVTVPASPGVSGGTYTVRFIIADLDSALGHGVTAHHAVVVPETPLFDAPINTDSSNEGGYAGSYMQRTVMLGFAMGLAAAFGPSHLLIFNTDGHPSVCRLMTLSMLFGQQELPGSGDWSYFEKDSCLGGEQLAAFRLKPELQSCGMCYWLTDECSYSSKIFAIVNDYSKRDGIFVSSYSAVLAYGVRPFALLV